MNRPLLSVLLLGLALLAHVRAQESPWDLETLFQAPRWEESDRAAQSGMQGLLFDAIPVNGKRVQVFAYYAAPKGKVPEGGWPAVVCVHGGGGSAFPEWVAKWNERGYAAISMDLEGHYPIRISEERRSPRIPTENPGLHRLGIFNNYEEPIEQQWYYHAVAQVIQAHSLMRSFPDVNPEKIGITGISWGGTLTSTVMGLDGRFRFAIPVYGCGYLPDSDGNQGEAIRPGKYTDFVNRYFDGSAYFQNVRMPVLWVNGTNDSHFPMPATQRSARAVKGPSFLRFEFEMRHGHGPGWAPEEIYAFADSVVNGGAPLARFGSLDREGRKLIVRCESETTLVDAKCYYTMDTGKWPDRKWQAIPAERSSGSLSAVVPEGTVAAFFSATDARSLMVTSEFTLLQ